MTVSLGVDIGGGSIKVVVLSGRSIVEKVRFDDPGPFESMLPKVVSTVSGGHEVDGIGVGVAGLVDHTSSRFLWGPHISDAGIDVPSLLAGAADRVVVDNDANFAAHAEAYAGAARGHRVSLTVSVGTGIGAGVVVDGAIQHGRAFAGEVGHMQMLPSGAKCKCGNSGCWETLVSGDLLDRAAIELGHGSGAEDLVAAAKHGHEPALSFLETAGRWLGVGVGNLVLALDPSTVVLTGGVSGAGALIIDPANVYLATALPGAAYRPRVQIVGGRFGRWAAATGAAMGAASDIALGSHADTVEEVIDDA